MTEVPRSGPARWGAAIRRGLQDPAWRAALGVGLGVVVLLGWWVLRSPGVSLADNNDWSRYSCPVGLRNGAEFANLDTTIAAGHCPSYDYRSTFVTFLAVAKEVDTGFSGEVHLRHLAAWWSLVAAVGWAALTLQVARATDRAGRAAFVVGVAAIVGSDVGFTSYFGSLYAEAMVLALLPAVAACLVRLVRTEELSRPWLVASGLLLVAVTEAKPSLALVALLFLGAVLWGRRGATTRRQLLYGSVAAVLLALFSIGAVADPEFTSWNTYNLAFTAVLPESGHPRAALLDLGVPAKDVPALERFVGVQFSAPVTAHWDEQPLTDFRAQGRAGILEVVARRPVIAVRLLRHGVGKLDDLHLGYLTTVPGTGRGGHDIPQADRPHPAQLVLDPLARVWWLTPIAAIALLAAALRSGARRRQSGDPGEAGVAVAVAFGVGMAATQVPISLADGYYELAKHLVIADFAAAVSGAALVAAVAWEGVAWCVGPVPLRVACGLTLPGDVRGHW